MLQLSLTLASDLYDLLFLDGEPLHFLDAARRVLALKEAPPSLCREVMETIVAEDERFCWHSAESLALREWEEYDPDLGEVSFVVVDVETTGGRPGPAKITEIGAVRVENLQPVAQYHSLVNPLRPIPPKITEITGITAEMVRDAPRIEELLPGIVEFVGQAVFVGHNAQFDLSFLNYEMSRVQGRRLGDGALDTLRLSRLLLPGLPNHRLATVAAVLGAPVDQFHRALPDAVATAHVFLTLLGRLQERGVTQLSQARTYADPRHRPYRTKLALADDVPRSPGTYLFRDENDAVLYVGKADCLRDRVRSYFLANPGHSRRIRDALTRLHRIDWVETKTPLQAVAMEQELIQKYRPPCNTFSRSPEKYVYLKARGSRGLRLYVSANPSSKGAELVLGPFRARAKLSASIDLLERCYPIRRCSRPSPAGCFYRQTGACLGPCESDETTRAGHDRLVHSLVRWLGGDDFSYDDAPAPDTAARSLVDNLSRQRRFEEAAQISDRLGHALATRRVSIAVRRALGTNTALLWPATSHLGTPEVHLDILWGGKLEQTIDVTEATASLVIGRAVRALSPLGKPTVPVALAKNDLDPLLATRQWLQERPGIPNVPLPSANGNQLQALDLWCRQLVAASSRLLAGRV